MTPPAADTVSMPRLFDIKQAAAYLSVSYWTCRDWVLQGLIKTVTLPALAPREGERAKRSLRRVLIDRRELDAFVDRCQGVLIDRRELDAFVDRCQGSKSSGLLNR